VSEREFNEQEPARIVVNDRRRIDPETGAVRQPAAPSGAAAAADAPGVAGTDPAPLSGAGSAAGSPLGGDAGSASTSEQDQITLLQMDLAERTQDLQRLQAEYTNYRRRVDRDREAVRDLAVANVVLDLLPVLDDIGRAAEHGELVGGFKSVADALVGVLTTKLGVETFGQPGEPFDPLKHEALMHTYSDEVTETTATQVFQPGYRLRDRILRPARVAVADPTEALPPMEDATAAPAVADVLDAAQEPSG